MIIPAQIAQDGAAMSKPQLMQLPEVSTKTREYFGTHSTLFQKR